MEIRLRKALLAMIKAMPRGWDDAAEGLEMTRDALENRIYERKGQSVLVDTGLELHRMSDTTHFPEAIAEICGGTFVKLPSIDHVDNESIFKKFRELNAELGQLSQMFSEYTEDNEVNQQERMSLEQIGAAIHKTTEELLALTFKIYCKNSGKALITPNAKGVNNNE